MCPKMGEKQPYINRTHAAGMGRAGISAGGLTCVEKLTKLTPAAGCHAMQVANVVGTHCGSVEPVFGAGGFYEVVCIT